MRADDPLSGFAQFLPVFKIGSVTHLTTSENGRPLLMVSGPGFFRNLEVPVTTSEDDCAFFAFWDQMWVNVNVRFAAIFRRPFWKICRIFLSKTSDVRLLLGPRFMISARKSVGT